MSDPRKAPVKGAVSGVKKAAPPSRDGFMSLVSFWEQSGEGPGAKPPVDPQQQLREMEAEIRRQGEEILANARAEGARIEEEAYTKGFARGEEAGRAAGEQSYAEGLRRLDTVMAAIKNQLTEKNSRYEEELLLLVTTMVDRLVHHEVSTNPRVIQACLQRALSFVVEKSVVRVHLHPDDFSRIREASLVNPALLEGKRRIELMEDGSIEEGGCFLETDFGDVDASLDHAREKLYDAVELAFRAAFAGSGDAQGGPVAVGPDVAVAPEVSPQQVAATPADLPSPDAAADPDVVAE